jgi:hypothetical protein
VGRDTFFFLHSDMLQREEGGSTMELGAGNELTLRTIPLPSPPSPNGLQDNILFKSHVVSD